MISRVSLCIGGITWCLQPRWSLQPHSEFVASFWICDLILIKNMLSFQREIGLSYIIWYTYCLVVCLVKQYQTNQHINNIFIEHVQAKTLSLNTPDIISQFHQIGSNVLEMITFVTEWYMLISYRKHLFASVYLKKTPQIFPSSATLLETNFFATTLNFCSF